MNAPRYFPNPFRAVIAGVHRSDVGEQRLRRANIARRLLAADVLLPCLQRQAQGGAPAGIFRDPDDPPRDVPLESLASGEERSMGSSITKRYAEALRAPNRHVRAELPRRPQQC